MTNIFNHYNLLTVDDDDESLSQSSHASHPILDSTVTSSSEKWGDINEYDATTDILPLVFQIGSSHKSKEEKHQQYQLNKSLSNIKTVQISHNIKVFNDKLKQSDTKEHTRTFNIVSENTFHTLKTQVDREKNIKKKVKLANSLMSLAYKDPNEPRFVYPIIVITLDDGRVLTRNEVKINGSRDFSISLLYNYPHNTAQDPAQNMA